jgi:hypothetical protein
MAQHEERLLALLLGDGQPAAVATVDGNRSPPRHRRSQGRGPQKVAGTVHSENP